MNILNQSVPQNCNVKSYWLPRKRLLRADPRLSEEPQLEIAERLEKSTLESAANRLPAYEEQRYHIQTINHCRAAGNRARNVLVQPVQVNQY